MLLHVTKLLLHAVICVVDVTKSYYMMCSVVTCYQELLHAVQCCYMLHCVVELYAAVLYVVMCSCMLLNFACCNSYYMLCSVVTCCVM